MGGGGARVNEVGVDTGSGDVSKVVCYPRAYLPNRREDVCVEEPSSFGCISCTCYRYYRLG